MKDIGKMTQEEMLEFVKEAFPNLTEENQIACIKEWVEELGGPDNIW
jgi:hypothetical protein